MLEGSSSSPDHDEEILADVAANFFRGIEGVGGRLKITSHRVLFEANEINLQEQPGDILGSEINLQQQPKIFSYLLLVLVLASIWFFRATRLSHLRLCRIRQEPATPCPVGWRFKQVLIIP